MSENELLAELRKQNAELITIDAKYVAELGRSIKLQKRNEELEAKLEKAVEALAFYANESNKGASASASLFVIAAVFRPLHSPNLHTTRA